MSMIPVGGGRRGGKRLSNKQLQARQAVGFEGKKLPKTFWTALVELYQARLTPERGRIAPSLDPTLNALYRRNLATGKAVPGGGAPDDWLWFATEEGAAMVKRGREDD